MVSLDFGDIHGMKVIFILVFGGKMCGGLQMKPKFYDFSIFAVFSIGFVRRSIKCNFKTSI